MWWYEYTHITLNVLFRTQNGSLEFTWTYPSQSGGTDPESEVFNLKPDDSRLPNGFASNVPIHINITRFKDNVRFSYVNVIIHTSLHY